jgi:superfamily II DNA or RNA helicase
VTHEADVSLRAWQAEALSAVRAAWRRGEAAPLVHACTGAGKSVLIAELCAAGRGRVLLTTPTQALVEQLAATVEARLPGEVGRAYQHAWDVDRRVVVTCTASLPAVLQTAPEWGAWICDEAHRIEGEGLRVASAQIVRRVACGLTATPFRGDTRGLQTWGSLVYSYGSDRAVADGHLVPWRVVRWDGAGEDDPDEIVAGWVRTAEGPGIVSATTVADAEGYAERIGALAIHGYLPRAEQARRVAALRLGTVRCLVHVQLLTEGVDYPWLRWLAIRRRVASPVRLVQEVGRVLRAAPGKTEAVLYDPHDCLGAVGLVHGATLEDAQRQAAHEAEETWEVPELPGLEALAELPRAVAVSRLEGWATDALGALRGAGLARPPQPGLDPAGPWRRKRASAKQRELAQRVGWALRYLPSDADRAAVDLLLAEPGLRAGVASDVLSVLLAVGRARGVGRARWPAIAGEVVT